MAALLALGQTDDKFKDLFEKLGSNSEPVRISARRELAALPGAKERIEARLAAEKDPARREELRLALLEAEREQLCRRLQQSLTEATSRRYRALAETVYVDNPKEVLALIDQTLPAAFGTPQRAEFSLVLRAVLARPETGGDWNAVRARCLALLRQGPAASEAAKLAVAHLNSKSAELKVEALKCVQAFEERSAAADVAALLIDRHDAVRQEALTTLRVLRASALGDPVAGLLKDPNPGIRREAALALGEFGSTAHAAAVAELLTDRSDEVRVVAAVVIGRLGVKEILPRVAALLDDPSAEVQQRVLAILGQHEAREHVPKIVELLKKEKLRSACLKALGRLGNASICPAVAPHVTDADPKVRMDALAAIGRLGCKDLISEVLKRLEDPDPWVRREAITVLTHFRSAVHAGEIAKSLKDRDPLVLITAVRSLGDLEARGFAAEIFSYTRADRVRETLKDPSLYAVWVDLIRAAAIEAVGRLRDPSYADRTAELVEKEPSVLVRKALARALVRMSGSRHRPVVLALLADNERAVVFETLLAINELAAPVVSRKSFTQSFDLPPVRESAPRMLDAAKSAVGLRLEARGLSLDQLQVAVASPCTLESVLLAIAAERRYDLGVVMSDEGGAVLLTTQEEAVRELGDWLRSLKPRGD
jgi:HEAT repeat protein